MADFVKALKNEISKVARKEIKVVASELKSDVVKLKKTVSSLRKEVAALNRENKKLQRQVALNSAKREQVEQTQVEENLDKIRVTGSMILKLRKRLKLSQGDLAILLGVTGQSVYQWERREGESLRNMRSAPKLALVKVRKLSVAEARAMLAEMSAE